MSMVTRLAEIVKPIIRGLEFLSPLGLLGIRLWVANVFWKAGLTKIAISDEFPFIGLGPSTLMLFQYEYKVPLLDYKTAAYLGTATELTLPILLAIGFGGRFAAIALFIFNIVAVISYPGLNEAGLQQHQLWGLMLALLVFYGPGKLSIDHFLRKKYMDASGALV